MGKEEERQKLMEYIFTTPENTNPAIVNQLLDQMEDDPIFPYLNVGTNNQITGNAGFTQGSGCKVTSSYSSAKGYGSEATGACSYSEGYQCKANAQNSHAEGYRTFTDGPGSAHAEGNNTKATDNCAHAEGMQTTASGFCSHVQGYASEASGDCSVAMGTGSTASGQNSLAIGDGAKAEAANTYAIGSNITANLDGQTVFGQYNDPNKQYSSEGNPLIFMVGWGNEEDLRNVLELDSEGYLKVEGVLSNNGDLISIKKLAEKINSMVTFDDIYPVGSTYTCVGAEGFPQAFGGKWEIISTDTLQKTKLFGLIRQKIKINVYQRVK